MPFDFDEYQKKCNGMTTEQLNEEWDSYTRQIAAGSTSTAASILLSVFTGGVSLVGLGFSAPRIHNARKKRVIIEAGLEARGTTHHTHAKDVLIPMATAGACSGLTLGLGISGAEFIPTTGGVGHAAVDYLATHAAVSGTASFVKYKARELSQRKDEETPEPGIQSSQTWPQGPPDIEKYGPQFPARVHHYSMFGHPDDEYPQQQVIQLAVQTQIEEPIAPLSQATPTSPSSLSDIASDYGVSIPSNNLNQGARSFSLPVSTSVHRKQIAQTQQEHPNPLQAFQTLEKPDPNPSLLQGTISPGFTTVTDTQLDDLVAALTDEEQMMLLMKLELEIRSPGGSQAQLHRTNHVHVSHGRRPHIKLESELKAGRTLEKDHSSSGLDTTPQLSISSSEISEEQYDLDGPALALPLRSPSLPTRPYTSQAPQQPTMPSRSPSLPLGQDGPQISSTSSSHRETRGSQISRKPLPPSQHQSYPLSPTSLQCQHPQLKDQRQDSGYYSAASTPSIPKSTDLPPLYSPASFSPTTVPPRETTEQRQGQHDFQASPSLTSPMSQPPPPYFSHSPGATSSGAVNDYFNHDEAPNTPAECASSPLQKERHGILGMKGWQWGTALAASVMGDTKSTTYVEPDYGPAPPIPAVWKG